MVAAIRPSGAPWALRVFASFAVIYVFVALSFLVMRPANPMASAAFAPLVVAMFYGLMGVWKGLRFLVAGAVLAALTMAGLFFLREDFLLWMAVGGQRRADPGRIVAEKGLT